MEKIIEFLVKHITVSEDDAIVAGMWALGGFVADALFFPGGLQPLTVTILSGASGLLISKWVKNRRYFLERSLSSIDKLVEQGHLTTEQGERYKKRIVENWLESTRGLPPEEEQKRLPQQR